MPDRLKSTKLDFENNSLPDEVKMLIGLIPCFAAILGYWALLSAGVVQYQTHALTHDVASAVSGGIEFAIQNLNVLWRVACVGLLGTTGISYLLRNTDTKE